MNFLFPKYHLLSVLYLLSTASVTVAQDFYSFNQISVRHGLSSQTQITSIVEDELGTYWFGTHKGANRLVGKEIIVYRHSENDSTSLPNDNVEELFIDKKSRLWIITTNGTAIFDHHKNNFRTITFQRKRLAFTTFLKESDAILLACENRVFRYSYESESIEFYFELPDNYSIYSLHSLGNGLYLAANFENGFRVFNINNQITIEPFPVTSFIVPQTVKLDSCGRLWFSLYNEGVRCYNIHGTTFTLLKEYTTDNSGLNNNAVIHLIEKDDKIWMATDGGGINILNFDDDSFSYINHIHGYNTSLPLNAVRRLYSDHNGNLWAGTVRGGVIEIRSTKIRSYENIPFGGKTGLSDNTVMALCQDDRINENLWIGTDGGGVNLLNLLTNEFTHFTTTMGKKINSIVNYSQNKLLISVFNEGVFIFDKQNGMLAPFIIVNETVNHELLKQRDFVTFSQTPQGNIRFFGNLLCEYTSGKTFRYFEYQNELIPTSFVRIASVTPDKIIVYDDRNIFEIEHESIVLKQIYQNSQSILCVAFDNHNRTWISDQNGLKSVNLITGKEDCIKLPIEAEITSLIADTQNRLWCGSNKGLLMYDIEKQSFHIYGQQDGVIPNEYLLHSTFLTRNGDIFLGGDNGLTRIKADINTPEVLPQQLGLFSYILNGSTHYDISTDGKMMLHIPWNYKSLSLKTIVRDFTTFSNESFRFEIRGNSSNNIIKSTDGNLSLTTLTSGQYKISASYLMANGEFSPFTPLVQISVSQPWWKTWWMITLEILLISTIALALIAFYLHRKKEKMRYAIKEHEQRLSEEKVQFLINISHELRTPLTLIYAPIKRLSEVNTIPLKESRIIRKILVQVQNIMQLVNMVLDVRKMEIGGAAIYIEEINLNNWLNEISERFRDEFESKSLGLIYQFDKSITSLNIDDKKTEIVINNLLMNALKYAAPNTDVVITTELMSNSIKITISDIGTVVTASEGKKMFERFYQTHHRNIGYGIGLSYAKMLVEMQGGRIDVNDNNGKGAEFIMELPLGLTPSAENSENKSYLNELINSSALQNLTEKEFNLSRNTVLFVDDDMDILELFKTSYAINFKSILLAQNGDEALEIIRNKRPDIVVSDVMMPEKDGFELCQALKSDIEISHIPIILLTAKNDIHSTAVGYKLGADSYIPKPFDLNFLLIIIRNILKNRTEIRKRYSEVSQHKSLPEETTFSRADEEFMKRLNTYIFEHISETLHSDIIAEHMGMSRTAFYTKMKAIANIGIMTYVTQLRIERAKELIRLKEYRMSEVAYMVGFSDAGYFSTIFKQVTGVSPSEWNNG